MSIEYKIKRISKSRYETVTQNHYTVSVSDGWFETVVIHKGFQSDLATIPKFARCLIKPDDEDIVEAAIIHDYLVGQFEEKGHIVCIPMSVEHGGYSRTREVSWEEAAYIMKKVMKDDGAPRWKKNVVYYAVLWYGKITRKD